ncbi:GMC oxidoreductase [Amaricoccus macauensis]|uniref:GMC oxidoreductase n=1 Tax=Amaricoccus macauensis TaxID=57001 RepID=UPI003C7A1402
MSDEVDVIVIGGGLGGGLAAWQLAQYGKSVLMLEAGPSSDLSTDRDPIHRKILRQFAKRLGRAKASSTGETLTYFSETPNGRDGVREVPIALGRGLGGSSALYSAALGRMRRSDFTVNRPAPEGEPDALPNDWPVDFDTFRSYYRRVENLFRVRGDADPGDPDDDSQPLAAPLLGRGAAGMIAALEATGHSPYRLRVGIDYVQGCKECVGSRCPWRCKADGYSRAIRVAEETGRLRVETGADVREIFQRDDGLATVVYITEGGQAREVTGHRIVLAAGALNSPLVLERSKRLWEKVAKPAMLGRGLMFHVSDLFIVLRRGGMRRDKGPRKWLALRDFYDDGEVNLGEIQSTGFNSSTGLVMSELRARLPALARGPGLILLDALRPLVWLGVRLAGEHPIVATITEDLPYARNHVREEDGKVVVSYKPSEGLRTHAREMRARLRAAFAPYRLFFVTQPGLPNWGHPMGTCRMGDDPATSVTTPEGRLHGHPNILVADASVFPSSGGTGPALTVAAQGIRAADLIAEDLAWQNRQKVAVVSARTQAPPPGAETARRLPPAVPDTSGS